MKLILQSLVLQHKALNFHAFYLLISTAILLLAKLLQTTLFSICILHMAVVPTLHKINYKFWFIALVLRSKLIHKDPFLKIGMGKVFPKWSIKIWNLLSVYLIYHILHGMISRLVSDLQGQMIWPTTAYLPLIKWTKNMKKIIIVKFWMDRIYPQIFL